MAGPAIDTIRNGPETLAPYIIFKNSIQILW